MQKLGKMLAIVFALQKFHFLVYGLKSNIKTDHNPLETIFKKTCISLCLETLRLRLLNYNLSVTYKPAKYLSIVDTLSGAFLSDI